MDWHKRAISLLVVGLISGAVLGCHTGPLLTETPATGSTSVPTIKPGITIGLVNTTGFGLVSRGDVDPDVPGGGTLITLDAIDPGQAITVSWRRTIEREIEPQPPIQVAGVGTPTPTPSTEQVSETGTIVSTGLTSAHEVFLPLYWQPGTHRTETSLIWLSREAFTELMETRRTRWSPDVVTRFAQLPLSMVQEIEEKVDEEAFYLKAEQDFVSYALLVNGENVEVEAIKAYDDFGNEYIIVADESNPLIVKFTFNAVSTGVIGIDAAVWTLIKATFSGYRILEIDTPSG